MKVDWTKLKQNIPHVVKFGRKSAYEVMYVDSFADPTHLGQTRFDPKQIVIKNGQTDKQTVLTFFHEVLHAIAEETKITLTENQVLGLEKRIPMLLDLAYKMDGRKNAKKRTVR